MKKINLFFCIFILCGCVQSNKHYIGEQYLGAKYINNPLGEEKSPDFDPLIRTDAFDCTTFVETALADGDIIKLTKIRYKDGNINFINRNNFIESDWIKNNANIVENISNHYGKTKIRTVNIDKKSWFEKMYNIHTNFKPETVNLEYIPYSEIIDIKNEDPLIVLFIVDNPKFHDKIGSDLAVIHMGFLLPGNILRHASRNQGHVVDTDFNEYIIKRKRNKNNIGITLLKIK